MDADKSNRGGTLANPGHWVHVEGLISLIPFLMSESLGTGEDGPRAEFCVMVLLWEWGRGILSQGFLVEGLRTLQRLR